MEDLIKRFLDAHVQHELNRFKNGGYRQTIEEEVAAIFKWTQKIKLKDVVTAEQIIGLIQRIVVEMPVAGGVTELAGEMSQKVLASRENEKTVLADIFARKQFDDIMDKVGSLKNAREEIIHHLVTSSVYSRQISEILYMGIKEYLITENLFVQKVPGVSSLIKLGRSAVNKTMPALESAIDNGIKRYIESNLYRTIKRSEKFLNNYFDEIHTIELGEEIWSSIAERKLSEYFKTIDPNDMEDFIIIGYEFWLHFRKTPYFMHIYKELVKYFFKKYGDKELDVILDDVGVSQKIVIRELTAVISPGIETAISIGYLEERIRARLESFYLSKEAASLVRPKKAMRPKKSKPNKRT